MRIGILSDSHDHVPNLRAALACLREEAEVLVHCGDLCAPFIVPILAAGFPGPVHAVFGNNDADRWRMQLQAARSSTVQLHGESFLGTLGGTRIAVQHFPDLGAPLAESGRFDVVCWGHDHRHAVERSGKVWRINPGSILGYDPARDAEVDPTFVVLDTDRDAAETWVLRDGAAFRA